MDNKNIPRSTEHSTGKVERSHSEKNVSKQIYIQRTGRRQERGVDRYLNLKLPEERK